MLIRNDYHFASFGTRRCRTSRRHTVDLAIDNLNDGGNDILRARYQGLLSCVDCPSHG